MPHVQTNFRAQDMLGSKNDRPAVVKEVTAAKKTAPSGDRPKHNEVPDGTSEEILAWVGDDAARARRALAKEKKDDNPRESVTGPLNEVIDRDKAAKKAAASKKAESQDQ
jgi:hypothetical protein